MKEDKKHIEEWHTVSGKSLEYVVFFPPTHPFDPQAPENWHDKAPKSRLWPVLCFLHGRGEGKPNPLLKALGTHGPLRPGSSQQMTDHFIEVAPQLPVSGKEDTKPHIWVKYEEVVRSLVEEIQKHHYGDSKQTYLTGFSFGGNGVFDIAKNQTNFWAALWAVDPTELPEDPNPEKVPGGNSYPPVWLSFGPYSRGKPRFTGALPAAHNPNGKFLYTDDIIERGLQKHMSAKEQHGETARLAYQDEGNQVFEWLQKQRLLGRDSVNDRSPFAQSGH